MEYFSKKFKNEFITKNINNFKNDIHINNKINIPAKTPEELRELSDRLAKEVIDEVLLEKMVDHIVRDLKDIRRACQGVKKRMKSWLSTQVEIQILERVESFLNDQKANSADDIQKVLDYWHTYPVVFLDFGFPGRKTLAFSKAEIFDSEIVVKARLLFLVDEIHDS